MCDDEETSCAFTHPTIPTSPEGLVRYPWGQELSPNFFGSSMLRGRGEVGAFNACSPSFL
jgi:hypothetical protein